MLGVTALVSLNLIIIKIDNDYTSEVPAAGGRITEGIVGTPHFINPLLAITDADRDISRIIYSGLMKSDGEGRLTLDLAASYSVSEDGLEYTFILKNNILWHDGEPVTANDVAFTVEQAKNPFIRSPKRANWEGVDVEIKNDNEIVFKLSKPYAPFLENTTLGILPKHIWEHITPDQFLLTDYNIEPIGSGPFRYDSLVKNELGNVSEYKLSGFNDYKPRPYILGITFRFYPSTNKLVKAFNENEISSLVASSDIIGQLSTKNSRIIKIKLPRIFGVFFNKDEFDLFEDANLRAALAKAVDRNQIIQEAEMGFAVPTSLPIPPGTFSHKAELEDLDYDLETARALLEKSGFSDTDGDGIVEKKISKDKRRPLAFSIATSNTPELSKTAIALKKMWEMLGADVEIRIYEIGDLEQDIIRPRNYDALLFGQVVGYDPDPFAFWHTSQRNDPGLNVALYANPKIDKILEDARSTIDAEKRKELYQSFQKQIAEDNPAIFLYSPMLIYITPSELEGFTLKQIPLPQERFSNIGSWYMNAKKIWKLFRN